MRNATSNHSLTHSSSAHKNAWEVGVLHTAHTHSLAVAELPYISKHQPYCERFSKYRLYFPSAIYFIVFWNLLSCFDLQIKVLAWSCLNSQSCQRKSQTDLYLTGSFRGSGRASLLSMIDKEFGSCLSLERLQLLCSLRRTETTCIISSVENKQFWAICIQVYLHYIILYFYSTTFQKNILYFSLFTMNLHEKHVNLIKYNTFLNINPVVSRLFGS